MTSAAIRIEIQIVSLRFQMLMPSVILNEIKCCCPPFLRNFVKYVTHASHCALTRYQTAGQSEDFHQNRPIFTFSCIQCGLKAFVTNWPFPFRVHHFRPCCFFLAFISCPFIETAINERKVSLSIFFIVLLQCNKDGHRDAST